MIRVRCSCLHLTSVTPVSMENYARTSRRHTPNLRSYAGNDAGRPSSTPWFTKIVLLLWLVSSVFIIFALTRIDSIVHQELYNFGLRFSYEWANPYWTFTRTIYVCIALPGAASLGLLLLDVRRKVTPKKKPTFHPANRLVTVTCPSCKKRFSNALVMYDYSKGKADLVNICPYCNTVLKDKSQVN